MTPFMKWPSSLTLIRHAESEYNTVKKQCATFPEWAEFNQIFNRTYIHEKKGRKDLLRFEEDVFEGRWPDPRLVELARIVHRKIRAIFSYSDIETPLSEEGHRQAKATGEHFHASHHPVPDVVHVSPALRVHQTYDDIASQWPALKDAPMIEEERIREQEHGLATLYGNWKIFMTLNPIIALLRAKEDSYFFRYPNAESVCNVRERTRDYKSMLIREYAGEDVMAFAHHLTILATRADLERWDHKRFIEADEKEKPLNCGVTVYRGHPELGKNGKLVLEQYNKIHY